MSILRIVRYISVYPQHFKLFRAIFIKERNGNAHDAIVTVRYLRCFIYIDSIVLIVLWIFVRAVLNVKVNRLVALLNVHVGKPADISHSPPFLSSLIHFKIGSLGFIIIRNTKPKMPAIIAQPHFVFLKVMKNLAYNCMVHIPQNQKLFAAVYEQREILFHQGERRVCHHDVALFQQGQTFWRTEVAVALQRSFHIVWQANLLVIIAADDLKFVAGLVCLIVGGNQCESRVKSKRRG